MDHLLSIILLSIELSSHFAIHSISTSDRNSIKPCCANHINDQPKNIEIDPEYLPKTRQGKIQPTSHSREGPPFRVSGVYPLTLVTRKGLPLPPPSLFLSGREGPPGPAGLVRSMLAHGHRHPGSLLSAFASLLSAMGCALRCPSGMHP